LVDAIAKPATFGAKLLIAALLAALCFACLDHVPDPPGIIKHRVAGCETLLPHGLNAAVPAAFFGVCVLNGPERACQIAPLFTAGPVGFDVTTQLSTAADSSPPTHSQVAVLRPA
jgi:hypothetical protein